MSSVRLEDIARKLNISVVTVSNALAGRKGVSDRLREEIRRTADEMGYRKRDRREKHADGYKDGDTRGKRIDVLINGKYIEKYTSFYWEMYQRTAFRASKKGCIAMLEIYSYEMEEQLIVPDLIEGNQADGIIVLGKMESRYLNKIIDSSKAPVVLLDFATEDVDCDAVVSNSFYGMYAMTNYLFRSGHRDIAYVGSIMATGSIMDRYQGYCKSLIEHGVEEKPEWIIEDRDLVTGKAKVIDLPEQMPTAFVCNSDYSASLLAAELKLEGYRVPEDISIVGYDDYIAYGPMKDCLTTYAVDMDGMASRALKLLMERIENPGAPRRIYTVDGKMIIRDSVKKI